MNCPYCNQPLTYEIYKFKGKISYILFCENDNCLVKPCTDTTTLLKAIEEIESMRMKNENN